MDAFLSQQGPLRRIWSLGALGEGSGWDLRVRPGAAASGNLGTWTSGNLEIWGPGNLEIWRSGDLEIQKFGVQKIKKIKILKTHIRSAQNVGKVWMRRKKSCWPYLGPSQGIFSMDRKNKKCYIFGYFPWWANGPYSPSVGPRCYPPEVGK